MNPVALLEVLDRDGHVRQSRPITAWPATVGRALDNDLVLDDPHVAAHHFSIEADAVGVFIRIGDTINGLRADERHLDRNDRLAVGDSALHLVAGDSHLCLRLAEHALAPELPLATPRSVWHHVWPPLTAGLVVLATLLFATWLETDPDDLVRALGGMLMAAFTAGLAWCAGWSLLSKIFTRRSHFWWHVRVLLLGFLALEVGEATAHALAFAMSWPWASNFAFVLNYAIGVAMLYFHMLGLEPRRLVRMRVVVASMFVAGTGLSLWFHHQGRDQFGEELYMNHLFPPALRLARPVDTTTFVNGLVPLQATLDAKAKKREAGDAADALDD